MKRIVLACTAASLCLTSIAQSDSTKAEKVDTIKIGGTIIIRKRGGKDKSDTTNKTITVENRKKSNSKTSTNWWIVDLGFANYSDNSNYATALSQGFVGAGVDEETMKLKTGKSRNVNLWFFMQRRSLVKKAVNLKYGLGLELNNYHFDDERIRFAKNPTNITLDPSYLNLKKNKLAADYLTVPLMLNFNFTPKQKNGFGFSAGVSGGYLYSSRQKIKFNDDKNKLKDDFNLRKWKLSYIGELNLGLVRLYGSYATKSMWEKGLDQTPYTVGVRLSHF